MEKKTRLPKPLVECEVPISLHQERADRLRGGAASSQEEEARVLSMKDWARHCYTRYTHTSTTLNGNYCFLQCFNTTLKQ